LQQQLFYEDDVVPKTIRDINYIQTMERDDTNIQRNIIKKILEAHPEGITDLEICILTGFSRSSVCARRNEIQGVRPVGYAKIITVDGDRLNTLWGIDKQ